MSIMDDSWPTPWSEGSGLMQGLEQAKKAAFCPWEVGYLGQADGFALKPSAGFRCHQGAKTNAFLPTL